jgi:hypothetical protein
MAGDAQEGAQDLKGTSSLATKTFNTSCIGEGNEYILNVIREDATAIRQET